MKKLLYLLVIAAAFASCKKLDGPNARRDRLVGLLLSGDTLQMYVGETRQLPLTVNPSDYHIDSIKWKSSDTTVLSISSAGLLTAKKLGQSTVSVSNLTGTLTVSALVTVTDSLKIGLLAYYPFNNTPNDLSGHNYNGVAHNVTAVADRFGNANGAYSFAGDSTSYVSVVDYPALRLASGDFTINAWVNLAQYNSSIGSHILSKRTGDPNSGYTYSVDGYGSGYPLGVQGFGEGGGASNAVSNSGIDLNRWHMLTVTFSPRDNTIAFYKDGVFDGSTRFTTSPANTAATMYFGKDSPLQPTSYFLKGALSDVRIYGRRLRTGEIAKLYTISN
jgi:hypothetical protein